MNIRKDKLHWDSYLFKIRIYKQEFFLQRSMSVSTRLYFIVIHVEIINKTFILMVKPNL